MLVCIQPIVFLKKSLRLLRNSCAEFLAEFVELLEHLLCETVVESLLWSLRVVSPALEVIVKIYSLVDYRYDFVSILVWVQRYEECAVINEFSYEKFDVFLENSKVHGKYVFKLL